MSKTGLPFQIRIVKRAVDPRLLKAAVKAAMTPQIAERMRGLGWKIVVTPHWMPIRLRGRTALGQGGSMLAGVTESGRRQIRVHYTQFARGFARQRSFSRQPELGYLTDRGTVNEQEYFVFNLAHEVYHANRRRDVPVLDQSRAEKIREEHAADVYALSRLAAFNSEPFMAVSRQ